MTETLQNGEVGTVLGILCNVRDALIEGVENAGEEGDLAGYLDTDAAIGECQRAIDLLKPAVFDD